MENENKTAKVGRPRIYTDIPDGENRDNKVRVANYNKKYQTDEEFRLYRKKMNAIYWQKKKEHQNTLITT